MDGFGSPFVNSVVLLIVGSGLAFLAAWFWNSRSSAVARAKEIATEHSALIARTAALEEQLRRINDVVSPIYSVMQTLLVKELTHDHAPEMDELMRLLETEPPDLTPKDDARLHELLAKRAVDDTAPEHERESAVMMPIVLKRARVEAAEKTEADRILHEKEVVLVSVPTTVPTP